MEEGGDLRDVLDAELRLQLQVLARPLVLRIAWIWTASPDVYKVIALEIRSTDFGWLFSFLLFEVFNSFSQKKSERFNPCARKKCSHTMKSIRYS